MKKIYKISTVPIMLFGFTKNVFACGGGLDLSSFIFISVFPLIFTLPLALMLFFIISKIKKRKKIFYFAIFILLLISHIYIAYKASQGLLCGGSSNF